MHKYITLIFITLSLNAFCQDELLKFEDSLTELSMTIVGDSVETNRYHANQLFIPTLVTALKEKNSFNYPLDSLKAVSKIYSPDSTFRILTWQMKVDKDNYRYYGAIQFNEDELRLMPLVDRSFKVKDIENTTVNSSEWFGGIYYNIHEVKHKRKSYYLLFGYQALGVFNRRKFIDVLEFDEKGVAQFGSPVFEHRKKEGGTYFKKRIYMDYSFEAATNLRYDPFYEMIIMDNLISLPGRYPGQGMMNVPDGSYQGYKLNKGKWIFIDKIFNDYQEEAPVPTPVLNDNQPRKDLNGKLLKN